MAGLPQLGSGAKLRSSIRQRVQTVRELPGLAAFWDFRRREDGLDGGGRYVAWAEGSDEAVFPLEPMNLASEYWGDGEPCAQDDFPVTHEGPFGRAVEFSSPHPMNRMPALVVPRENMHDSRLDIKGPGASVSMVVWLSYQSGTHAIAGLWHEGTDIAPADDQPIRVEPGRRQYGLFAGLWANAGAVSAHVSDTGRASFGDRFARHLATTPGKMIGTCPEETGRVWHAAGMVYDNRAGVVRAYLDGNANEHWVEDPKDHDYYRPTYCAWCAGEPLGPREQPEALAQAIAGISPEQIYRPPEGTPSRTTTVASDESGRIQIEEHAYTRVRVMYRRDAASDMDVVVERDLVALKVNPYWFGRDLHGPALASDGGPFTIGRVIHSNRATTTLAAAIGGVAVFDRALTPDEMARLAGLGKSGSPD